MHRLLLSTFQVFNCPSFFPSFPQPKFYKSVIDDVVNNVRELFLDDGVDEQVIQELKKLWEEKISETKALDHPSGSTSNTIVTNSKSNNSKKSAAAAAAAAAAVAAAAASNSTSAVTLNSLSAAAAAGASSSSSTAGGQTSVIKSNPYHVKNGPLNNSPGERTLFISGLPSTIQYAARAPAPLSQQATIGFLPGQVVGQTTGQAPNAVNARVAQLDGLGDSSSEEDDEDEYRDNDDDDNDDEMNDEENDGGIEDEVHILLWFKV